MKIKSALLTSMSGSIGGLTGSHNAGGLYLRARRVPVNPNTAQQQEVRNAMAIVSTYWRDTLTAAQRTAWRSYAAASPLVDSLGDSRPVSGNAMFVRCNVPRQISSLGIVAAGPTAFGLPSFSEPGATPSAATDMAAVTFDALNAWANEDGGALFVYASRPQPASIEYFNGPYRLAGIVEGDAMTPPSSPAAITLPFPVEVGQAVFFRFNVTRADGRLSGSVRIRTVAV